MIENFKFHAKLINVLLLSFTTLNLCPFRALVLFREGGRNGIGPSGYTAISNFFTQK